MKQKMKTKKAALKRFKVTKSGKILHRGHGIRHLRSNKSKKQLRSLNVPRKLTGRYKAKIKKMLGV